MGSALSALLLPETPDVTYLLQQFSADDTGSMTALQWASSKGHVSLVKHLLEETDVDIDYYTTGAKWELSHSTALDHAVQFNSKAIVAMLLENGANINIPDEQGNTVVHQAAVGPFASAPLDDEERMQIRQNTRERQEILQLLLLKGPDLSTRNEYGCTPLHSCDNGVSMEMLLDHGAPVNAQDKRGNTVLHFAADMMDTSNFGFILQPNDSIVRFLLNRGADPSIKNFEKGLTPLHIAAANGYHYVVNALLEGGADAKATNNDGLAPVDYIRKVVWSESRGSYARMVLSLLRASGVPEAECQAISDERHQGDKAAHDRYSKEAREKFMEWANSLPESE